MSKTLIYLEDDEALAFVTARALQKKGYEVFHFADISQFSEQLRSLRFDCALLDLKIGSSTSLNLIQEIKSVKDIPIVILTGYGTIRTAVQAMKLGAINFLSKPCSVAEIIEAFEDDKCKVLPTQASNTASATLEKPSLKAVEWESIQQALDDNQGNVSAAARQLKMHRRTLQRKLSKRHVS